MEAAAGVGASVSQCKPVIMFSNLGMSSGQSSFLVT